MTLRSSRLRPSRSVLAQLSLLVALFGMALAAPAASRAQEAQPAAADGSSPSSKALLLVEAVDTDGKPLADFDPSSLQVSRDGAPLPVTVAGAGGPGRVVIYFDLPLLSTQQVLAAASALSDRASALTRVGEVEVVVGDEDSRTVLPPSADPEIVSQSLAGVGARYGGRDALAKGRSRFLTALAALAGQPTGTDTPRAPLAPDLLERIEELSANALLDEAALLRQQRERLVLWAATEGTLGPARPAALVLVTGGFDDDALAFYRDALTAHGLERDVGDRLERPVVLPSLDEVSRVLAVYGWLTDPYVPRGLAEEAAPPSAGAGTTLEPPSAADTLSRPGLDASEANDTGRPALITPKLGHHDRDQKAGPALPPTRPGAAALAPLAVATGGEVITDPLQIEDLLNRLPLRSRIEVPVSPGEPERLEFDLSGLTGKAGKAGKAGEVTLLAPRWIGETPPRSVAAVRVRRLLDGERPSDDELPVEAAFATPPRGLGEGRLTIRLGSPSVPAPASGTHLRATIGIDRGDAAPLVFHKELVAAAGDDTFDVPVTLPEGAETRLAVLVEELPSGRSGSAFASYLEQRGSAGGADQEDEAGDTYLPSPRVVRLIAPGVPFVVGETTFNAVVSTPRVQRVDFFLDGQRMAARVGAPFQAVIDVGSVPKMRRIEAVAYADDGSELGRDTLVINQGGGSFRVRIVEPRANDWSSDHPLVGPVDVEADVTTPGDTRIEQVEFYWNAKLVATSYAPPFRQRVVIPQDAAQGFIRVVARLEDGATTEDVVFVNSPGSGERLDVNLVEMYVVVTDKQGHPVTGLTQDDFQVFEEGEPQKISTFRSGAELPLTVGLAIDSSASMFVKLPAVGQAAGEFVHESLHKGDRAFVVGFGGEPELVQQTTGDTDRLLRAIEGLRPVGQTALWESLVYSLVEIQGAPGKKALVVYTDGADEDVDFSYRTALRFARRVGVPIYFILTNNEIVRTGGKGLSVRRFLGKVERLSGEVGGRVFIVRQGADLSKVYHQIGEELRSQYLLAYYSKDLPEETWRRVKVETTQPGLETRTITGTYR